MVPLVGKLSVSEPSIITYMHHMKE